MLIKILQFQINYMYNDNIKMNIFEEKDCIFAFKKA